MRDGFDVTVAHESTRMIAPKRLIQLETIECAPCFFFVSGPPTKRKHYCRYNIVTGTLIRSGLRSSHFAGERDTVELVSRGTSRVTRSIHIIVGEGQRTT